MAFRRNGLDVNSKDDSEKSVNDFLWIILVDVIQPDESECVSITGRYGDH